MSSGGRITNEGLAGPHSSRLANAADPRVDSDLDSTRNNGAFTTGAGQHTSGVGYTGAGLHSGPGTAITGSTNAGPHNSNIMNKLDPTVDSDLSGRGNVGGNHAVGSGGTTTSTRGGGFSGGISNSTNAGPHNSNLANKADPRVDSDLDGRGNRHGAAKGGILGASGSHATPGSGTAQNTAGPHNSDLANKLDPRVDSDLDGSKTIGGNKTRS